MNAGILGIGPTEVIVLLVVLFILFGHRLPSVMRLLGRGVADARQRAAGPDRQLAILACLMLMALLIGLLAIALLRLFAAPMG